MSESQNYEEVTVASHGITVIKTFEEDAFPVPAIAFRIQSDRTETVSIRLVDEVPENVAVEDLGFHPEYGSEYWTIEDDEITFEREIEPEEQYTTVYGIRATGTDDVEQFLTEPKIADVDPPLEDEEGVVGGSGSDVVRDVISGNTDSVPGLEDEEDDEDIGTLDLADPNAPEAEGAGQEPEADEEGDDEEAEAEEPEADAEATGATNGEAASIDSVASALAEEIRDGNVDDDDMEVLRDELDLDGDAGPDPATDARIEKLQSDVTDLEAYIDALEEFLEENGKGEDLIREVQDELDGIKSQVNSFEDDIDENTDQINSVEGKLNNLKGDVNGLKADIKDFDDDMDELQSGLDTVESELDGIDVDDMAERIDDIEQEISDLKDWKEQLSSVLGE